MPTYGTLNRSSRRCPTTSRFRIRAWVASTLDVCDHPRLIHEAVHTNCRCMSIGPFGRVEETRRVVVSLRYLVASLLPLLQMALGQVGPIFVQLFRRQPIHPTFLFHL